MSKEDNSGPAFPLDLEVTRDCIGFDGGPCRPGTTVTYKGVSIRDYFAAKAMQGILSNVEQFTTPGPEYVAEEAYKIADAMLEVRNK